MHLKRTLLLPEETERVRKWTRLAIEDGHVRAYAILISVQLRARRTGLAEVNLYRPVDNALQWLKDKGLISYTTKDGWRESFRAMKL